MNTKKMQTTGVLLVSFTIWLLFDIFTKKWAVSPGFEAMTFVDHWFYLTEFQKNEGIAFSIAVPRVLQIVGSILILTFLLIFGLKYLLERKKIFPSILMGCVLAGGVGNLIERIGQGYVVDFIVLRPLPVFNIADIGITVGLVLLFATMSIEEYKTKKHE